MKSRLALASCLTILALGVACGDQAPQTTPVTTTPTKSAPAWVDNPNIPEGLADVGIAQANPMGDKAMQRTTALADARTRLAGQLKVRVQNMFSQLNQQVTTATSNSPKNGKPLKSDVMQRVTENVTRNLVDQELQGATVREWWLDPSDGSLYCHLVMSKETLERVMQQQAQKEIRNEIAQGEVSLENALDKLDAAIAASR
nr:LPP20 family lipoprotein [uncultured Holophaga sp.]